jgi:hypothetical protein
LLLDFIPFFQKYKIQKVRTGKSGVAIFKRSGRLIGPVAKTGTY